MVWNSHPKVHLIAGARPNFVKIAPLLAEFRAYPTFETIVVHTGQHYDNNMSRQLFNDLCVPLPDVNLGVGSASHGIQTARIMMTYEPIVEEDRPDLIIVVGDTNSTLACALTAAKLLVPVAHVEAGLRSFDLTMPEEINRRLTDALSRFLFTTCREADASLLREGMAKDHIFFVGNVMIDTLVANLDRAKELRMAERLSLANRDYALLTLHRPNNVDNPDTLERLLGTLGQVQRMVKIVFPIHPRTLKQIRGFGFMERLLAMPNLKVTEPLGYLEFLGLMQGARFVLTDSGGIQEETTFLGIPCLTLRENTERPVTVKIGTNTIVGTNRHAIVSEVSNILDGRGKTGRVPELWDGRAAERIVGILVEAGHARST